MTDYSWLLGLQNNNSTTSNKIPNWLTSASQYGVNNALAMLKQPAAGYTGELAAGMTPDQTAAGDAFRSSVGKYDSMYGDAGNSIAGSTGQNMTVDPRTYMNGLAGIGAYMNPYVQNVIGAAQDAGDYAFRNNLNTLRDRAIGGGSAFGSRQGVQEGAAAENAAYDTKQYISNALSGAYDRATGLLGQDIQNNMNAQTTNAANYENYMNRLRSAGIATQNLADARRTANVNDINNVYQYGAAQQSTQNAIDQARYNEWLRMQNMPLQMQQLYNQTLSTAPHNTTSTTNSTSIGMNQQPPTSSNPWMGAAGGALSGAAAGAPLGPWGIAAGAAIGGATGAMYK